MRILVAVLAIAISSCATSPPNPRHVGADDYMAARAGSAYLGESQDHAFRRKSDGAIIFTDTEDLPAGERAKVRSAGKTYTGAGSKVRWH